MMPCISRFSWLYVEQIKTAE